MSIDESLNFFRNLRETTFFTSSELKVIIKHLETLRFVLILSEHEELFTVISSISTDADDRQKSEDGFYILDDLLVSIDADIRRRIPSDRSRFVKS